MKTLVLCDFDGTLFKKDSFPLFIKFYHGVLKLCFGYLLFSPLIILYYLKIFDGEKLKKKMFNFYFKNADKADLEKKGERFLNEALLKNNLLNNALLNTLNDLKKKGAEICIVSASLDVWIKPFANHFNYNFLCTELKYISDTYQGEFLTKNCNNIEKKTRVMQHYNLRLYDEIIAFGDSGGDKYLMEIATKKNWIKF
ncbi:MAG: haloacid dehalogenase-like hydrolase [Bacteroidia bacterium]|nr:haloacid dehalogenase-like hydrolase [Bacteroidia bacterium]